MKVCYLIARECEAHIIGEKLVKTRATDLAACAIDEKAAGKIQLVSVIRQHDSEENSRFCSECTGRISSSAAVK
jgi:hypothetical protein